jgi:hypothetical protein
MLNKDLNIDYLKANAKLIHYFGLGFIQLKLTDSERLHFYTPHLPPIVPEEDVHDHRYDFTSKIWKGELNQELFRVIPGDTHILEQESCKEGVPSSLNGKSCGLEKTSSHKYVEGSEYFISHGMFHRVETRYCITYISRSEYKKDLANVIRPVGQEKVCPFSQKIEEVRLWEIVENMVS